MNYMIGDKVSYVGSRHKLSGKLGIILSRVLNCSSEYVVEFDDTYVMHESLIARYTGSQTKDKPANAEPRQKKRDGEVMIKEEKPQDAKLFISEDDQKYAD